MRHHVLAASLVLAAVAGCTGSEGTPASAPQLTNSPLRTSPEPRPYTVPTSPATDRLEVLEPTDSLTARNGETDVPWRLIRLWDERFLAISYAFGCNEPGRVVVREEDDAVVVRVLRPPLGEGPRAACASTYRKIIRLDEPLGDRPLLHVV